MMRKLLTFHALLLLPSSLFCHVYAREQQQLPAEEEEEEAASWTTNNNDDDNNKTKDDPEATTTALYCGCTDCTAAWQVDAGGLTCGQRIRQLQDSADANYDEWNACLTISDLYPFICGPACHPQRCDGQGPAVCGCKACTADILARPAGNLTCGERIRRTAEGVHERAACISVSFFHPECGPECDPQKCDGQPEYCGCYDCTQEIWETAVANGGGSSTTSDSSASTTTCGSWIAFYESLQGGELKPQAACRKVAQDFPNACRPCHPEKCDEQASPSSSPYRISAISWMVFWYSWEAITALAVW
uniref:Uncharacterized protein n=1 Tax=Amphora coffeiformis TaxID=265554 RepID=A0A7S3PBR5_9STRA